MQNKVVFFVGDGRRVKFWKDKWCKNIALCDSLSSLYALTTSKEAWLVELWDSTSVEGGWTVGVLGSLGPSMIGKWRRWGSY